MCSASGETQALLATVTLGAGVAEVTSRRTNAVVANVTAATVALCVTPRQAKSNLIALAVSVAGYH